MAYKLNCLKKGGENMTQWVWQVIKKEWTTEELQEDWKTSLICPIHNKWAISETVTIIEG